MNAPLRRAPDRAPRFYSADHHNQLRDLGIFAKLKPAARDTLIALIQRANARGEAWPAAETIARDYGLGISSVRAAFGQLQHAGLITLVENPTRKTKTWRLLALKVIPLNASKPPSEIEHDPSIFQQPPLRALDPIMTSDHQNDHDQQQHAGVPAHEDAAVAFSALPSTGENPRAQDEPDQTPPKEEATSEPIALLEAELVDRVRQLGIPPAKVNRYGADRVRWVLERLDAERKRKVIGNPAGWVVQVLKDTWNEPLPVLQLGLPFAAAAAEAARPPEGTRWGRHREGGALVEVLDVNGERVKLSDGVVPAHHWGKWEWFTTHPDGDQADLKVPDEHQVDENLDPIKRSRLAMLATWAAVSPRTSGELAAKLAASGLTLEDWGAHQRQDG